jgi:predicted metal-dependent peptidase
MTPEEKIDEAKTDLAIVHPFFAYYLLSLPTRVVTGGTFAAKTDGTAIYYGRERTADWTVENFMFVQCHEIMHVVLDHTGPVWLEWQSAWTSIMEKDLGLPLEVAAVKANILIQQSADHVINLLLKTYYSSDDFRHNRRPEAPGEPHCDPVYAGLSVPEVCERLYKKWKETRKTRKREPEPEPADDENPKPPPRPSAGQEDASPENPLDDFEDDLEPIDWGLCESFGVAQEELFPEEEVVQRNWPEEILLARRCEESFRTVGSGTMMSDLVMASMPKPKIPWQSLLRPFVSAGTAVEMDWYSPDRRFLGDGLYLPSDMDHSELEGVFVRDTSGSVSDEDFAKFTSEILATVQHYAWGKIHLLDVTDTVVHTVLTKSSKEVDNKRRAYGGTDFNPPFEWLTQRKIRPKFLIYFTDGYGAFPPKPGYPVMWLNCAGSKEHYPAWAKVINLL